MKTIIAPTDFSPVSINAMNYAAEMAQAIGASLLLMHAYQVPVTMGEMPMPMVSVDEMERSSREKLQDLRTAVEHISSGTVKVYTEARLGEPVDQLQELCEQIRPFAVVMGSHGTSGWERLMMGSTTLTSIRHLKWPVIVVPPGSRYHAIRKIGLACDFKNVVESTPVSYIKEIVHEFGAELHVLNVEPAQEMAGPNMPLESAYLETMLEDAHPLYHFLEREDVIDGIIEFAEKNNLDMMMVIPKKHKLLDALFHKSSSRELVSQSHIPILSIHE